MRSLDDFYREYDEQSRRTMRLMDESENVRWILHMAYGDWVRIDHAMARVKKLGEKAIPDLIDCLLEEPPGPGDSWAALDYRGRIETGQELAAELLGEIGGEEAVKPLTEAWQKLHLQKAYEALEQIARRDKSLKNSIRQTLQKPFPLNPKKDWCIILGICYGRKAEWFPGDYGHVYDWKRQGDLAIENRSYLGIGPYSISEAGRLNRQLVRQARKCIREQCPRLARLIKEPYRAVQFHQSLLQTTPEHVHVVQVGAKIKEWCGSGVILHHHWGEKPKITERHYFGHEDGKATEVTISFSSPGAFWRRGHKTMFMVVAE